MEKLLTGNCGGIKMRFEAPLRTTMTMCRLDDGSTIFCGNTCLEDTIENFSDMLIQKLGKDADLWFRQILEYVYEEGGYDRETVAFFCLKSYMLKTLQNAP